MLDLAIIGGGPAGTAAAIEARRRGLGVAVWERDRFPRHKVCGEFISPEALTWLQQEVPEVLARGAGIHRAEFIARNGLRRGFTFSHPARGLSRYALDASLWKAGVHAGIEMHEGETIRSVRKSNGKGEPSVWELESSDGNVARARTLIIACGRWWRLEGFPSPPRQPNPEEEWVGVKAHFAGLAPRGCVEMYLFQGGYCGVAPVEDGQHNACCLVRRKLLRAAGSSRLEDMAAWLGHISRHTQLKARLHGAAQTCPTVTTAPVRLACRSAAQDDALLAGDASGFIDPFTGEGISMALHSGRLAGIAIAEARARDLSPGHAAKIHGRNLGDAVRQSYRIAGLARALIAAPAWVQNLSAAPLPWLGSWLLKETRWRSRPIGPASMEKPGKLVLQREE